MTPSSPTPALIDPADPVLQTGPAGPGGSLNLRLGARVAGGLTLLLLAAWGLTLALPTPGEAPERLGAGLRLLLVVPLVPLVAMMAAASAYMPRWVASAQITTVGAFALLTVVQAAGLWRGWSPAQAWVEFAAVGLNVALIVGWNAAARRGAERLSSALTQAAERDTLTGLLNRFGLLRWREGTAGAGDATLLLFDVNGLKGINDGRGHSAGDAHLQEIAGALTRSLPPGSALSRWGGDEFVAILPGVEGAAAREVAERASAACAHLHAHGAAFAVGQAPLAAGERPERALAVADERMYDQKRAQREESAARAAGVTPESFEDLFRVLRRLDTPGAVLDDGLTLAREWLGFDAAVYLVRGEGGLRVGAVNAAPGAWTWPPGWPDFGVPYGEGLAGVALAEGATVWTADYQGDLRSLAPFVAAGLRSAVVTPVGDGGQAVGVLALLSFTAWRAITPEVRRGVEGVALQLGFLLLRQSSREEVQRTFEGGLLNFGVVLEARDVETAGHTERVVRLATELGEALGLPSRQIAELRQGAYLHDIGKLVVPDAVLCKPGALSPEEWAVMRTHPARGFEIATRLGTLPHAALEVVRDHHERWDGTGYPAGRSGADIPLLARVFSVVDVYDALTSERPYKVAWSHEAALAELRAQAGRQFDPEVVAAFGRLLTARESAA